MIKPYKEHQLHNAHFLKEFGVGAAARYLQKCGWSLQATMYVLLGKTVG